jgi:3-oxoacyl-[acyl-carrier-protein] synthase II
MEKAEIRKNDLYSRYAMAAACQAVEDGAIAGKVAPERFGVYLGAGVGGLSTISGELETLLARGPKRVSPFFVPMMIANIAAGNIAIRFGASRALPCRS